MEKSDEVYHSSHEMDEAKAAELAEEQFRRDLLEEEWLRAIQLMEEEAL